METSSSPPVSPPQRRRRSASDAGDTDTESQASKRRRFDDNEEHHEDEEEVPPESEGDILPDSYRRSPKGKQRARATPSEHTQQEHKPGSIVRISMRNFVTYTNATFHPGPNLNMIIGPNGTGKSTLVCGICLGLGWKPEHLGRAKDISEFVKHGCKEAVIEIELKADPTRQQTNPIIGCKITRDGSGRNNQEKKTAFKIDGKTVSNKAVQEFVRSFSIQVDNLCQFLPQDRVVEFAALSPIDLLVQTQRAAAPSYMSEYHEDLKKWRKEEKRLQDDQQNLIEDLKKLEDRQRAQANDVERMREREVVKEKLALLKKFKPVSEFNELRRKHTEAKAAAKDAARELRRLEQQIQPNMHAVNEKQEYLNTVERFLKSKERMVLHGVDIVSKLQQKFDNIGKKVTECDEETKAENASATKAKSNVLTQQQNITSIKNAMASPPPAFDAAEMNQQVTEMSRRIRTLQEEQSANHDSMGELKESAQQRKRMIEAEQEKQTHLQSQAGKLESKLSSVSQSSADLWKWIQANQDGKFHNKVYGPPMIECSVQGSRNADWIEAVVGVSELKAFTVTDPRDFKTLSHQAYQVMKLTDVNIRSATQGLDKFPKPEISTEDMTRMGLDGWLLDLVEGPEPVLAMLCDGRNVHRTAFCNRDTSEQQFELLKRSALGAWVTPANHYQIVRRSEYGDAGTSTKVAQLKKSRFLTDAPVSTQAEEESNAKIRELRGELDHIRQEMEGLKLRYGQLRDEEKKLTDQSQAIKDEKAKLQQQKSAFDGLPTKLASTEARLAELQEQLSQHDGRKWEISQKQMQLIMDQGQVALDHGRAIRNLESFQEQAIRVEINRIEATSDLDQLKARNEADLNRLQAAQQKSESAKQEKEELMRLGVQKQRECVAISNEMGELTDLQEEVHTLVLGLEPTALETEITSVEASLDLLAGNGNANLIRDYGERAKKIDDKRARRDTLEEELEELGAKIRDIRSRWEPQLDELIRQISDAFAENFARIQCAGEVGIDKQDDFAEWAIQIKVKFRENEQLQVLDSHRQSGGERAVSTIFYLMALQSMARAPFRVVDEINQGMDPRNERLVHSRMVDIACAEHTSQYFLITPKLLNNLRYHPNMKVHCIASGEYMPDKTDQLDTFENLAQVALRVKGGGIMT
ncbi:hypothetical protein CKM354_000279500 [Cercospora kikuchii]|uniref:Structural maintenance of chromosomes protein 5 n=1 Tax=Cercospora kikuchii TaxID=84275 RepID=A0A9P3CFE2_9PEZI|nr:DNA repair ATPase SMC5 [Cercospora kikuchii]GIZ39410.1 hypothetical protein CKM354_000279500 [Cercospora kikuchii]